MKTSTSSVNIARLNDIEGMLIERRTSRRAFLHGAVKTLAIVAAGGAALPLAGALAAPAADGPERSSGELPRAAHAGYGGIEALRAVAFGLLGPAWLPTYEWEVYLSGTGIFNFLYPRGWYVYELPGGAQLGAWLTTPDQSAMLGAFNLLLDEPVDARDSAWRQIDQIAGAGNVAVLYDDVRSTLLGSESFVAVEVDGYYLTVHCIATTLGYGSSVNYSVQLAGVDEFDAVAETAFLPFVCQFIGRGCSGDDCESEGNGSGNGGDDDDDDDDDGEG